VCFLFQYLNETITITKLNNMDKEKDLTENSSIEKLKEKEYEILKQKYIIAVINLQAVLCYIVPDNCRIMVNKALDELNDKKYK